ncbi:chloramphenicol resistance protein [Lineolata rhizophorae]|uniref:Chloramphenicol resistance protein n=1 Tax=Lineolata rhizophorae TaxID=578093 RepID=A0A6A6PC65_9PEZI|nr:chloramphenicol resistance protein [Lineolata rhizophorae]
MKGDGIIGHGQGDSERESIHKESKEQSEGSEEANGDNGSKEQDLEGQLTRQSTQTEIYSAFSFRQRFFITAMACIACLFSPLSINIYFPALNTLADHYSVSSGLINLTITMYSIMQAIAPAFFADLGDEAGRRPAFLLSMIIYFAANIGLALQDSYAALMVLRLIQSAGSSGTVSLSKGNIADIAPPSKRGSYMAFSVAGAMLAPALAPVLGGILAQFLGWRSIFWFLLILSALFLVPYFLFVPETNRKVVGNGSIPPQRWYNKSGLELVRLGGRKDGSNDGVPKKSMGYPRPWKTVTILRHKDVFIINFYVAYMYAAFYTAMAALPQVFNDIYGFNDLQIGLCYLPLGGGAAIAAIFNGKMLDWNYRRIARKHGFPVDSKRQHDMRKFPIEEARISANSFFILLGNAALLCYGWALDQRSPLPGPLVLLFFMGVAMIIGMNSLGVLLVDLFPHNASTVSSATNLCRCVFGAVATAVIDPMIKAMGLGWCYTLISLVAFAMTPCLWIEEKYGPIWREERYKRLDEKKRRKEGS